jgi:hypothetical protein
LNKFTLFCRLQLFSVKEKNNAQCRNDIAYRASEKIYCREAL